MTPIRNAAVPGNSPILQSLQEFADRSFARKLLVFGYATLVDNKHCLVRDQDVRFFLQISLNGSLTHTLIYPAK